MAVGVYFQGFFKAFDDANEQLALGTVEAYVSGGAVHKDLFTDAALSVAHSWPVTLDANGRAEMYFEAGAYDLVLKDVDGNVIDTITGFRAMGTATSVVATSSASYNVSFAGAQRVVVLVDATSGPKTVNLPDIATAIVGYDVVVKKVDASANAVTVDATPFNIDGAPTMMLEDQWEAGMFVAGSTLWLLVGSPSMGSGGHPLFPVWGPASHQPPSSNYATLATRNGHLVLEFDGGTDEETIFPGVLSAAYSGGGLEIDIWVMFASAISGTSRWQAAIERMDVASLDLDSDSFAVFQSAAGAAQGTSGQLTKVTIAFTDGAQMDGLAAGEAFRLKIRRDADGTTGTDDIVTDAQLVRVAMRETA